MNYYTLNLIVRIVGIQINFIKTFYHSKLSAYNIIVQLYLMYKKGWFYMQNEHRNFNKVIKESSCLKLYC